MARRSQKIVKPRSLAVISALAASCWALLLAPLAFAQTISGPVSTSSTIVGPLTPALRQVATGSAVPTYQDTGTAAYMCRSSHRAGDNISSVSIGTPNYYIATSNYAETASGASVTAASWVEYPRGTFTQMLYGGATSVVIASGARAQSDQTALQVAIPAGASFSVWQRLIGAGSGRVLFVAGGVAGAANGGEGCNFGANAASTPQTATIGDIASTTTFKPDAIVGLTTQKSFLILGDSRSAYGVGDARSGGRGDVGEIAKGLGAAARPYISVGNTGESMVSLIGAGSAGRTNTVALSAYTSDVINQLGINDINGGVSLATIQGYYSTIRGYFTGKPTWLTTKPPISSGAWTNPDLSDQTTSTNNSVRVSLNNWMRGYPTGYAGFYEIADACENGRNGGKWKAPGYTGDGIHATALCYDLIRDGGYAQ